MIRPSACKAEQDRVREEVQGSIRCFVRTVRTNVLGQSSSTYTDILRLIDMPWLEGTEAGWRCLDHLRAVYKGGGPSTFQSRTLALLRHQKQFILPASVEKHSAATKILQGLSYLLLWYITTLFTLHLLSNQAAKMNKPKHVSTPCGFNTTALPFG